MTTPQHSQDDMPPLSPIRSRKRNSTPAVDAVPPPSSFPGIQPFPDDVPTAPLLRISLAKLLDGDKTEEERLFQAACELGFFYIDLQLNTESNGNGNGRRAGAANRTVDGDELLRCAEQLFLVQKAFFKIPLEEKQKYDFKDQGSYFGYKGYGSGIIDDRGTKDRNEFYNISKDDILGLSPRLPAPQLLDPVRPVTESFVRCSHALVTHILTVLNARLGLPADTLANLHRLTSISGDQVRFIRAPPQPKDDQRVALGEHTDFGSVTVLFNRIGGLQVRLPRGVAPVLPPSSISQSPTTAATDHALGTTSATTQQEQWAYVRPLPGHAIVNLGDALVKFTAGILRSAMHRVASPPGRQASATRYSLVYFARPEDDVVLRPVEGAEAIDNALKRQDSVAGGLREEEALTSKEWILRRALGRREGGTWKDSMGTERP